MGGVQFVSGFTLVIGVNCIRDNGLFRLGRQMRIESIYSSLREWQ